MMVMLLEQLMRLRVLRYHLQSPADVLEAELRLLRLLRLRDGLRDQDHGPIGPRGQVGGGLLRRRGEHGVLGLLGGRVGLAGRQRPPGGNGRVVLDGVDALDAALGQDVGDVVYVLGVDRPEVVLEEALAGEGAVAHLAGVGPVARVLHHVAHQRVLVPEVERADAAGEVLLRLLG